MNGPKRCQWASDPLNAYYHDQEWGVPVHNDQKLFEFLILEGAQAGLSWLTILKRREAYREAFADFNPLVVSKFTKRDITRLLKNEGLIRNRLKIESVVSNAKAFLMVQEEFGSFDNYIWSFVDGKPIKRTLQKLPATTPVSDRMSKDLKKRGFKFVGSTICYAYMQACGLVDDHDADCFKFKR